MKHILQWFVIYAIGATALGLLVLGLVAGGVVLQFKALILVLTPLVGLAAAYALTGLTCFVVVLLLLLALRWNLRSTHHAQHHAQGQTSSGTAQINTPYESTLLVVKKYPLEAAMVAFAAGLSAGDTNDLKKLAAQLLQEA